jgi:hypothetical protein
VNRNPSINGESTVEADRRVKNANDDASGRGKAPQMVTEVSHLKDGDHNYPYLEPRSGVRVVKAGPVDYRTAFLPSKLPLVLPDGSPVEGEALLVAADAYAIRLSDDTVAAALDAGELTPLIDWPENPSTERPWLAPVAIKIVKGSE